MTNSRAKGARGERELAGALRDIGFTGARRGQQYKGTPDSPDIADAIPGVHIECKRVEKEAVRKWVEQAHDDAGPADIPVVMHRKNNHPWLVTVPLQSLEEFCRRVVAGVSDAVETTKTQEG